VTTWDPAAHDALSRLIYGAMPVHLIAAAAEFSIADHLADGAKSSAELAAVARANPDALHRVLRALAQLGVLTMLNDGRFALAPLGEYLRSDAPRSLRATARAMGADFNVLPGLALEHTLRTGETASEHVFGMKRFEYMAAHPERASIFNELMTGMSVTGSAAVVAAYDCDFFDTIVDVGGGNGTLIAEILKANSRPQGIIFDLPHCRTGALEYLAAAGVESRCDFIGGDFFESVPAGADAYFLKWIIHDWNDERSVAILQTCRRAMVPTSRLIIVERLLPSANESAPEAIFGDITMLVNTGGRERSEADYRALLEAADLRLTRVVATSTTYHVLEAVPVS
jgi:hypothetical protein